MPDAINPSAIPADKYDPDAMVAAAGGIKKIGGQVSTQGAAVVTDWTKLSAVYEAPEASTLFAVMDPVKTDAETVGTNLGTVSSALSSYAEEIRPIVAELKSLQSQAQTFVDTTVANGVDQKHTAVSGGYAGYERGSTTTTTEHVSWDKDQGAVDANNDLIRKVNAAMTKLWAAERTCANKIYDIIGFPHVEAATNDNPNGYGVDSIPDNAKMPWGATVKRTESCGDKAADAVGHFVWDGVIKGGLWGTIKGLGTLILGYNPNTGAWFDGATYGAAWKNMGMLGVGLVAESTLGPVGVSTMPGPVGKFLRQGQTTLINTGKSLIAYDEWSKDPAAAAGTAVFNIGTIVLPGGAEADGVKAGGSAAAAALRTAGKVASVVDPTTYLAKAVVGTGKVAVSTLGDLGKGFADFAKGMKMPELNIPKVGTDGVDFSGKGFDGAGADGKGFDGADTGTGAPPPRGVDTPSAGSHSGTDVNNLTGAGAHVGGSGGAHVGEAGTHVGGSGGAHVGEAGTHVGGSGGAHVGEAGTHVGGSGGAHAAETGGAHSAETGGHDAAGSSHDAPGHSSSHQDPPTNDHQGHTDSEWNPDQGDPTLSDADHGPGWDRDPGHRGDPVDPHYGDPQATHGTLDPKYHTPPVAGLPQHVRDMVTDPGAPYGRDPQTGHEYTLHQYEERYVRPDGTPRFPGNDGAVAGRRIDFNDLHEFKANYGDLVDRFGKANGDFMSFPDTSFEARSIPGSSLSAYHTFQLGDHLPPGYRIEVSEVAPAFGQPGGGLQVRVLDHTDAAITTGDMRDLGILQPHEVTHDATATPAYSHGPNGADSSGHSGDHSSGQSGGHSGGHEGGQAKETGRHRGTGHGNGRWTYTGRHREGPSKWEVGVQSLEVAGVLSNDGP